MRVTAVIVAYNRQDLLRENLCALAECDPRPDTVIVVDNASVDDSVRVAREALRPWGVNGRLIELCRNTGGAGGFTVGVAAALAARVQPHWVWVMDDDTIPGPAALRNALAVYEKYRGQGGDSLAVLASRVTWCDGSAHPMNTPSEKFTVRKRERARAYALECVPVRSASFVSVFLRAARIRECGLPVADFFLWNDDFEYTTRLARRAHALLAPGSLAVHKTASPGGSDSDPGPRFFFEVRNKLWVFLWSCSLSPGEKLLYFAASLRRWLRTYCALVDVAARRQLRGNFWRGCRAGFFSRPKSNVTVLADAGVPADVWRVVVGVDARQAARRRWRRWRCLWWRARGVRVVV